MRSYSVLVTESGERDVAGIHRTIRGAESPERAALVVASILDVIERLAAMPDRGHWPPELERIGVVDFREVHWKPYRIIYEIDGEAVIVHAVLDSRRRLDDLLLQRLLR